jgi:hypothetical protein
VLVDKSGGDGMKRIGRPPKEPVPGTRHSLGLKVTADIKARLDKAARESGRTQSQEAEARLERSFDRADLLSEVLSLTYGRRLAGILIELGVVMQSAAHVLGYDPKVREDWALNVEALGAAQEAARTLLRLLKPTTRPAGEWDVHASVTRQIKAANAAVEAHMDLLAEEIRKEKPHPVAAAVFELLGPMATARAERWPEEKKRLESGLRTSEQIARWEAEEKAATAKRRMS